MTCTIVPEHLENRVVVVPLVRMSSTRLPGKLMKTLGGKPLASWTLESVRDAALLEGVDVRVGVGASDNSLVSLVRKLGMIPMFRNDESINGGKVNELYNDNFVSQLEPWDWVVLVCCCSPFIPVHEYRKAFRVAKHATHQGLSAIQYRGWVWNGDAELVIGDLFLDTQHSPVYFTPAHIYDILRVEYIGTPRMLEGCLPVPVEDSLPNRIHVDTEEDWRLAELYLQSQQLSEGG